MIYHISRDKWKLSRDILISSRNEIEFKKWMACNNQHNFFFKEMLSDSRLACLVDWLFSSSVDGSL